MDQYYLHYVFKFYPKIPKGLHFFKTEKVPIIYTHLFCKIIYYYLEVIINIPFPSASPSLSPPCFSNQWTEIINVDLIKGAQGAGFV